MKKSKNWLYGTTFLTALAFGAVVLFLPFIFKDRGVPIYWYGIMMSVFAIISIATNVMWGHFSDLLGRKAILTVTLFGMSFALMVISVTHSFIGLFVAICIWGFFSGSFTIFRAAILDGVKKERMKKVIGLYGMLFGLGMAAGPILGLTLAIWDAHGFYNLIPAFSMFLVIIAIGTLFFVPSLTIHHTQHKKVSWSALIRSNPILLRLIILNFMTSMVFAGFESSFALWILYRFHATVIMAAILLVILVLMYALVQGGFARMVSKTGETKAVLLSLLLQIVGFIILDFSINMPMLVGGIICIGLGSGIIMPSISSMYNTFLSDNIRGKAFGILQSSGATSRIVAPVIFIPLIPVLNGHILYALSCILCLLAIFMVFNVQKAYAKLA